MTREKAIRKARDGEFEFISDIRIGTNTVRYQSKKGNWKEKKINVKEDKKMVVYLY